MLFILESLFLSRSAPPLTFVSCVSSPGSQAQLPCSPGWFEALHRLHHRSGHRHARGARSADWRSCLFSVQQQAELLCVFLLFDQSDDLFSLIEAHEGKELELYVYSTDTDNCRKVVLTPNSDWGGEGRYDTIRVTLFLWPVCS